MGKLLRCSLSGRPTVTWPDSASAVCVWQPWREGSALVVCCDARCWANQPSALTSSFPPHPTPRYQKLKFGFPLKSSLVCDNQSVEGSEGRREDCLFVCASGQFYYYNYQSISENKVIFSFFYHPSWRQLFLLKSSRARDKTASSIVIR